MLINNFHQNTADSIAVNQIHPEWFPINQGVRQGDVLTSFFYLVFMDDLSNEIETCS